MEVGVPKPHFCVFVLKEQNGLTQGSPDTPWAHLNMKGNENSI